jgi:hypothetical protein
LQPPGDDRDLVAAARHNRVLAFDNLSSIPSDLSDSLARLATGAEIGGRQLYSDHDTASFTAIRPVVVNGIPDLAARADLADRAVVLRLDALGNRMTERDWRKAVETVLPSAFGALLDAMVVARGRLDIVPTPEVRMADFARLVVAAEPALPWQPGEFLAAYGRNRGHAIASLVEGDPVAIAVREFMAEQRHDWTGRVSELHVALTARQPLEARRGKDWPANARWFSDRLRRATPALRAVGIAVHERRSSAGAMVALGKIATLATSAAPSSDDASGAISSLPRIDDASADFDERAAIAEFDGGMSRADAEALARAAGQHVETAANFPIDFGKTGDA